MRHFVLCYMSQLFQRPTVLLALVGYEMIIANLALSASLVIYHLISNAHSWNKNVEYYMHMGGGAGRTLKQVAHVTQDKVSHPISRLQEVGRRTVG